MSSPLEISITWGTILALSFKELVRQLNQLALLLLSPLAILEEARVEGCGSEGQVVHGRRAGHFNKKTDVRRSLSGKVVTVRWAGTVEPLRWERSSRRFSWVSQTVAPLPSGKTIK